MAKVGDRIISKKENGQYDILIISGARELVRPDIATLEAAREIAREGLPEGGQVWYRDLAGRHCRLHPAPSATLYIDSILARR